MFFILLQNVKKSNNFILQFLGRRKRDFGDGLIFPFFSKSKEKNIEYKKMKRFCVSKFETRNS